MNFTSAAVGLSGELGEWLGQPLPSALAYDYPTIDALTRHLVETRIAGSAVEKRKPVDELVDERESGAEADRTPAFFTPNFGHGKSPALRID